MVNITGKTKGVTYLDAMSSDVLMVKYVDTNKSEIYINNEDVGVWNDNNPKEDTVLVKESVLSDEEYLSLKNEILGGSF